MSRPVELIFLLTYVLAGPVTWVLYTLGMLFGRKQMVLLRRPILELPADPPSVTILIPAKDEGQRIRGCLTSAATQDYPNFDVVAIDDRSTDDTGAVMDELAANLPRLRAFHNQEPPGPGWTGKNNALWQGQRQASGQWLLFIDSDVMLEPDALRAAMAVSLRKRFDLLSLLPRVEAYSFWESTLIPVCAGAASMMYRISLSNANDMKTAFANGQFILMSRACYDAIGGHESVKDRFCEDIAIAQLVKDKGMRPRISTGDTFCSVRMYDGFRAVANGWSRIYYAATSTYPRSIQLAVLFMIPCVFSLIPALAWGLYRLNHPGVGAVGFTPAQHVGLLWLALAAGHWAGMTVALAAIYRWSRINVLHSLLFVPVAAPVLFGLLLRSWRMCVTKKVTWRGTTYSHTMAK